MNKHWKRGLIGLLITIAGITIIEGFGGGIVAMQAATTPAEFTTAAVAAGNDAYVSNTGDTLLFAPGLFILAMALFGGLGASATGLLTLLKRVGVTLACMCLCADTLENIITYIATGFQNLDAPNASELVQPSTTLITIMSYSAQIKFLSISIYGAIIVVLLLAYIIRRLRPVA
jgi:hypothetical protein